MEEARQLVEEPAVVDLPAEFAVVAAGHLRTAAVTVPVVVVIGMAESGDGFGVAVVAVHAGVGAHAGRFAAGFGGDSGGISMIVLSIDGCNRIARKIIGKRNRGAFSGFLIDVKQIIRSEQVFDVLILHNQ